MHQQKVDECTFGRGGLNVQTHPADHAIAVAPAQRGLHARDTLVGHTLHEANIWSQTDAAVRIALLGRSGETRISPKRTSSHSTTVPVIWKKGRPTEVSARKKEMRKVSACGQRRFERPPLTPRLRGLEDEVVERVADLCVLPHVGVREVVGDGVVLRVVLEPAERVGVSACGRVV